MSDQASGENPGDGTDPRRSSGAAAAAAAEAPAGGGPVDDAAGDAGADAARRRRRGSRGGRNRSRPRAGEPGGLGDDAGGEPGTEGASTGSRPPDEMPERPNEGRPTLEAAERALVRRPRIGDTRPAPAAPERRPGGRADGAPAARRDDAGDDGGGADGRSRRRRGNRSKAGAAGASAEAAPATAAAAGTAPPRREREREGGGRSGGRASSAVRAEIIAQDAAERRRGRERNGRPVGRYTMAVHVHPDRTQIAVLEGRNLIEHYVSRPTDDVGQIHGNIYIGRVQNVLPGMEAAFVDIGTPKNAVLYRGDVQYEQEDILERGANLRIEQMLKPRQTILCQVVKNPIGAKGARLTQEVSLPGRFVVLIPNSSTYGISKRLPDEERKRLRAILDKVKPAEHGVIVRTAAEDVTSEEIQRDVLRLLGQWHQIEARARTAKGPTLLHREPDMAVRVIREEFNASYRSVVIDDPELFADVRDYVGSISPELADRVEYYDPVAEGLPLFERNHVHEQLHKALDRKVWLPSGGSLIIEHTEALTVIDVNTGRNVGTSNLEETVFRNNLEAAEEIARQLRLRDIGGIIVIDFIDMEVKDNRQAVISAFRNALARDKTRTQVFDISELGLVEMTRKRIGEGLLTAFADTCPVCDGRGVVVDHGIIGEP